MTKMTTQPKTRIRERRKALGMTLKDLAIAIGTTPQTIQRLETGTMTVSLEWMGKIATALGTTPAELLHNVEPTPEEARAIEAIRQELVRSRRHVPDIRDVPMELIAAMGRLSELWLGYSKELRAFDCIPGAAAEVAAMATRITLDGETLRAEKTGPKLVDAA